MGRVLRRIDWAGLGPWGVGFGRRPFFVLGVGGFRSSGVGLLARFAFWRWACSRSVASAPCSFRLRRFALASISAPAESSIHR